MRQLASTLAAKFSAVAVVPLLFGVAYIVRCETTRPTPDERERCWFAGGALAGIGGGALAGYNVPNPRLDKARHALAEGLQQRPSAAAGPAPPLPRRDPRGGRR